MGTKIIKKSEGRLVKELMELEKIHGALTPHLVVDSARRPDSPLHDSFDWNDETAAEKYRLAQARTMITTVQIEYGEERRDAFYNVKISDIEGKASLYLSSEKVFNDVDLHAQVLGKALEELEYWQRKYDELKEARTLVNQEALVKTKNGLKK